MRALIRDGRQISRVCIGGKPAYLLARGCKLVLPGANLWWPKKPQVANRGGVSVLKLSDGRWRLNGALEIASSNLGGWFSIPPGTYRLDTGVTDPRITMILSGRSQVTNLGNGLWRTTTEKDIILYLVATATIGETFDVIVDPTMVRVA